MSDQPERTVRDGEGWLRWTGTEWVRCAPASDLAEETLLAAPSHIAIGGEALARTSFAAACIHQLTWIDPGNPVLALARSEAAGGRHRPLSFIRERRCAAARFGPLFTSLCEREAAFVEGVPFPSPAARLSLLLSAAGTSDGSAPDTPRGAPAGRAQPSRARPLRTLRPTSSSGRRCEASSSARRVCATALSLLVLAAAGRWVLARALSQVTDEDLLVELPRGASAGLSR